MRRRLIEIKINAIQIESRSQPHSSKTCFSVNDSRQVCFCSLTSGYIAHIKLKIVLASQPAVATMEIRYHQPKPETNS